MEKKNLFTPPNTRRKMAGDSQAAATAEIMKANKNKLERYLMIFARDDSREIENKMLQLFFRHSSSSSSFPHQLSAVLPAAASVRYDNRFEMFSMMSENKS